MLISLIRAICGKACRKMAYCHLPKGRTRTVLVVLFSLLFLFLVLTLYANGGFHMDNLSFGDGATRKTILMWRSPWRMGDNTFMYNTKFYNEQFFSDRCGSDECILTQDQSDFERADVVLFVVKDVSYCSLRDRTCPARSSADRRSSYPQRAHPGQLYVFIHLESPLRPYTSFFGSLRDLFNITYTYLDHPDTDIVQRECGYDQHPRYVPPRKLSVLVKRKTKMAFSVISNCKAQSQRNGYIAELAKYIQVDIYGKCGKACNDSNNTRNCFQRLENQYKFYLAFENSFCMDYVTEKLCRSFHMNFVPIVLAGGNLSKFPPRSFIDVRDFPSPRHLAKYLRVLDKNDSKYMEYFNWKKKKSSTARDERHGLCRLCGILQDRTYVYKSGFDPVSYWNATKYCKQGQEERNLLGLHSSVKI